MKRIKAYLHYLNIKLQYYRGLFRHKLSLNDSILLLREYNVVGLYSKTPVSRLEYYNISPRSVRDFNIGKKVVTFQATIHGSLYNAMIPLDKVIKIEEE